MVHNWKPIMAKFSWKKVFICLPLLLLLVCFLARNTLMTYGFEKYIQRFAKKVLDGELQYAAIYYQDNTWVLKEPRLIGKKAVEEGGIHFYADSLAVKVVPDLWERKAEIHLLSEKPEIHVLQASSDIHKLFLDALSPAGLFSLNANVNVTSGTLHLHKPSQSAMKFHFQIAANCSNGIKGCLKASLIDPTLENNVISIAVTNTEKRHFTFDFDFADVDCASLVAATTSFYSPLKGLSVDKGTLQGKLTLTVPKEGQPYAVGDLILREAKFTLPKLELSAHIREALIHLAENQDPRVKKSANTLPRTIGHLEISQDSEMDFKKDGRPICNLKDLKGSLYFQTQEGARVEFQGLCLHHGEESQLNINGEARFAEASAGALDLSVRLVRQDKEDALTRFVTRELGSKFKFVEISLANMGPNEFDLWQALLIPHFPETRQVHMDSGRIDATVLAYMKGLKITDFKIEKLLAQDLKFAIDPWEVNVDIGALSGSLAVNLDSEKVLETLNADLIISNGLLTFAGFDRNICRLSDIQTNLTIRRGMVHQSLVKGEFAGLQGTISIDGLAPDGEVIKLNFAGGISGLEALAPETMRKGLQQQFADDHLILQAGVRHSQKQSSGGLEVQGNLGIKAHPDQPETLISFGFELQKASHRLWGKWPAHHLTDSFWHGVGEEVTRKSMPALALPSAFFQAQWLKRELGVAGVTLRNGWFQAKNLELEKYLAPYLLTERSIKLVGKGDFEGAFDHNGLAVNYAFREAYLETPQTIFDMRESLPDPQIPLPGTHYFDFDSGIAYGTLPVNHATFSDRRSGVQHSEVQALISFLGKKVQFSGLQTSCCGITFQGKLDFDFNDPRPGYYTVDIATHNVQGTFSQMQELFSHFDKLKFFQRFPLEGKLALREKGSHLLLNFNPQGVEVESDIQGVLYDGSLIHHNTEMSVKNLSFNFDFQQVAKKLAVTDIQGVLTVGQGDAMEEYAFAGEQVHFTNTDRNEAVFDLWIGDKQRDIVRFAGKTKALEEDATGETVEFLLDKQLSHFGDVHPDTFQLALRNWNQVEKFHVEFSLSLETILHDLQALSRTGLLFLPENLLMEINALKKAEGQFAFNATYDHAHSALEYRASGENVAVGKYLYKKCLLEGKKKGSTWAIEQLILDDVTLAADLTRLTNSWKVNFLGARFGNSLLMGLEGDYRDGDEVFDAKVNLLEINLAHLDEWPALRNFASQNKPKGFIRATGQLHLETQPGAKQGFRLDTLLNGSLKSWEMAGMPFQDAQNVSFHFTTERGLTMRNLSTALKGGEGQAIGLFQFEKVGFDSTKEELVLEGVHFNVPAANVVAVTKAFQESFPEAFTDKVVKIIRELKESNNLEGTYNFRKSPAATQVLATLKEGSYKFNQRLHEINNFTLTYDLKDLKVTTQYRYNNHLFWLVGKTQDPSFDEGTIQLADYHPEQQQAPKEEFPLEIVWKIDPTAGFTIRQARGYVAGMHMNLQSDPEFPSTAEELNLMGEMALIPTKAACLVSETLVDSCTQLQVGDGYTLKGQWRFGKQPLPDDSAPLHFNGLLEGTNWSLKGYQFQTLTGHVHYVPGHLEISDLRAKDPAGTLHVEHIYLYREDAQWKVSIPQIVFNDFKPSFLREVGAPAVTVGQPLTVQKIEIQNLSGLAGDPTTLTGKGTLQFANQPKKHLQNIIFAIPREILTLIGLNLTVLNPVSGSVLFDVRDGRFYLIKLKDVYSEGRMSKFLLSNRTAPSHVDFQGNLNVQIRMKQYNLFFKLAELFTFNIQGTLTKPTYSLSRHKADKKDDS